jgi:hypothetical protein
MERVERAAKALYLRFSSLGTSTEWGKIHPDRQAEWREEARKILAAADPELMADPPAACIVPIEKGQPWPPVPVLQ